MFLDRHDAILVVCAWQGHSQQCVGNSLHQNVDYISYVSWTICRILIILQSLKNMHFYQIDQPNLDWNIDKNLLAKRWENTEEDYSSLQPVCNGFQLLGKIIPQSWI